MFLKSLNIYISLHYQSIICFRYSHCRLKHMCINIYIYNVLNRYTIIYYIFQIYYICIFQIFAFSKYHLLFSQIFINMLQIYYIIWVNYNDLTVLPHWKSWFISGKSSPFMAARFRLVNYYNLPRYYGDISACIIINSDILNMLQIYYIIIL